MINVVFGIKDDLSCAKKSDNKDILEFVKNLYENFILENLGKFDKNDFFDQIVHIPGYFDENFNFFEIVPNCFSLSEFKHYLELNNRIIFNKKGVKNEIQKD